LPAKGAENALATGGRAINSHASDALDVGEAGPTSFRQRIGELLAKIADRDEGAFADLLTLMSSRVYSLCTRMMDDEQVALETTQDVFLEVWQKAHAFNAALGKPDTWVTMIAVRRATGRARSQERARRHEADYLIRMYTRDYDHTSETALDLVEQQEVRAVLKHLSPPQAQAITLSFYGGLTYEQVATELRIPLPTVKSRIRDALIVLRKMPSISGIPRAPSVPATSPRHPLRLSPQHPPARSVDPWSENNQPAFQSDI
jgi:RNA polymerase sigma-70 factor (ECF subfamily)